jgi:hypothetical protein
VSKYETALLRHPDAVAAVAALQPRAVVATYPVDPREAACLLAAREAGIDTVIHLLSWDNITSKGHLGVLADHYLAWGPIMASEFTERYGVRPEQISQVGVPHFDAHVRAVHPDLTRDAVAGLGLDPSAPYLFFGMSSPVTSPHEIDVVEWLAEGIEAGRFGSLTQLLVRPHPQNVRGHMADLAWLPRLDALASKRVAIDYPTIAKSRMLWSMNPEDLARLVNLIAGSAITLNSGSTLAIDAMVQDKPVIVTAFDAGRDLPWWCSASRVVDYVHLKKLFALGGVSVVHGFAELGAAIDRYLANPEADAEGRARSRAEQLFAADDRASARAADALASLLAR